MMKSCLRALFAGLLVAVTGSAVSQPEMRENAPDVYYVEAGDTLWDIAARFLESPWQWPELWHGAEDVENPHLIYPGDVIRLRYVEGEPQLVVEREPEREEPARPVRPVPDDPTDLRVVRVSPEMRETSLEDAIPAIPLRQIRTYLRDALVVTAEEIAEAPHVVGGQDGRVAFGQGDRVYARDRENRWEGLLRDYGFYRVGERYVDPETQEVLGYEALEIGRGRVTDHQDELITLQVQRSSEEIREETRLFATRQARLQSMFHPSAPDEEIEGRIIRFFDRLNSVARHDVVVINKGERDGLAEGNVLRVMQSGERVRDRVHDDMVSLPDTRAGLMILFNVHEKVSFGLIMESSRPIFMHDRVVSP